MLPDYKMANRFLDSLTSKPDGFVTFQYFRGKDNIEVAGYRHLKRSNAYPFLKKKQDEGCGVYVMVNEGDGKGRKTGNVLKVRALFVDLDGSPWEPAAERLQPHIRVESSPGRWHLYWKVSPCNLEDFKPLQQALAKKYGGDVSCVDLPRVLRVPGFYHLKTDMPFMTRLVEVNDMPEYTTSHVAYSMELKLNEKQTAQRKQPAMQLESECITNYEYTNLNTGEVIDLTAWAVKNPRFDIVAALDPLYCRGDIRDGKQHIQCPFEHEHTDSLPDMATFIVNASPPQYTGWNIHCMHSHCVDRDRLEFLSVMLEKSWLSGDIFKALARLELKRPSKVYFTTDEISASLSWTTLNSKERRIAFDLMYFMWSENDGTIVDDDWMIARRLDIPEAEWIEFRKTFIRTGWLIKDSGRLQNEIIKREFDNAQYALMKAIAGGRTGGLRTQSNRRVISSPP